MMIIRSFEEQDTEAIVQLWHDCGLTKPWNDPHKDIQRKSQVGQDLFLVGEWDGKIVASVMGGYEGHRGWVNYLAVHPDLQGQGLGRQLMEHLEQLLLKKGCPKLNLQVRATNSAAVHFYQKLGYNVDECISLGKRLIPDT